MNKSYVLLCMCEDLKNGKCISLEESLLKYKISEPTFRRYIATLRDFFLENLGEEIKYVSSEKCYKLEKVVK